MGVTASALPSSGSACLHDPKPSTSSLSLSVPNPSSWFAAYARQSILSVLESAVKVGHLTVTDVQGTFSYGYHVDGAHVVHIKVVNQNFWTRILLSADLGFSEAYMIGEVECDDLKSFMHLWLDNTGGMDAMSSTLKRVSSAISGLSNAFLGQTRSQARLNAIISYDQSNELFKAFLSQEMMYSCALWGDAEGGVRGDLVDGPQPGDLEAAQHRKIHHVLRQARVKPGHRILEFGSGWGGLAIEAARSYGCEVDTLTLSIEQKTLAEERVKAAGLVGRIRVHLMDYREIPSEFEKAFDAFISIEMIEHVGAKHYKEYFKLVDFALKSSNATMVITSSTFPEYRYSSYQAEDFTRRYMWPNSSFPSATALVAAQHAGTQGRFTLERIENHAAHYPRTLREWGRRLEKNLRQDVVSKDYIGLDDPAEYNAFKRKWQYLFAYAAAGFAHGYLTCHMLTYSRASDVPSEPCD